MTELDQRLRDAVRPAVSEQRLMENWRQIARRSGSSPSRRARWIIPVAVTAAAALAWLGLRAVPPIGAPSAPGPLRMVEGPLAIAPAHASADAQVWSLSDGSVVHIAPLAELGVTENDGEHVSLALARGRAEFDIQPGGPRRWRIDAGACAVEVLGTSFVVDRHPDGAVHVAVSRGHVAVRSASLAGGLDGGIVHLTAGQSIDVPGVPAASAELGAGVGAASAASAGTSPVAAPTSIAVAEPAPVAPAPELPSTSPRRPSSGEALLVEAEAARTAGRPWDAAPLLRRFVTEHPRDVGAARAAFSLARMELDQLGHPDRAADAFARALALGLGGDLAQIARARRVEALHAAGDHDGAARAARDYFAHHPEGEWAREVRAWSGAGP